MARHVPTRRAIRPKRHLFDGLKTSGVFILLGAWIDYSSASSCSFKEIATLVSGKQLTGKHEI